MRGGRGEERKKGNKEEKKALMIEAKGEIVACPRLCDITENYFDTC